MYRLLGRIVVVVLLASITTLVAMGRETTATAFGRWLGPEAGQLRGLSLESPIVADVLDAGARLALADGAERAGAAASGLARRGPPPSHGADVDALTTALRSYAAAATSLSTCAGDCRSAAVALDMRGADARRLADRVDREARRRRL